MGPVQMRGLAAAIQGLLLMLRGTESHAGSVINMGPSNVLPVSCGCACVCAHTQCDMLVTKRDGMLLLPRFMVGRNVPPTLPSLSSTLNEALLSFQ